MKSISTLFNFLLLIALTSSSIAQLDWTKYPENPVLVPGEPGTWNDSSGYPFCVLFIDGTYHMWSGGYDGTTARIGYFSSPDGIIWTPYAGNPVMDKGPEGSWEDERVLSPYMLYDGSTYHMWYAGYDGSNDRIGYATSTDKVTWTKYVGNPVMDKGRAGSWEVAGVTDPCIYFDGAIYHMWYAGYDVSNVRIGYATSPDGLTWTKYADNPVLIGDAGAWDVRYVRAPEVFFDGTTYHMWYNGTTHSSGRHWKIGYATSPDGITWTKYAGNPVLMPSSESWESQWVGFMRVLLDSVGTQFKMWYGGGSDDVIGKLGYATAPDTMAAFFVFEPDLLTFQFSDKSTGIISDWLWEFGDGDSSTERNPMHIYDSEGTYSITLTISGRYGSDDTTQQIIVTSLDENTVKTPARFILFNNYPNPFNPSTTIKFQIPNSQFTTLKVYNILGEEVSTLVSEKLHPGNHTYTFDGKNLASGVYYYQLRTDSGFIQTKKLVLLR